MEDGKGIYLFNLFLICLRLYRKLLSANIQKLAQFRQSLPHQPRTQIGVTDQLIFSQKFLVGDRSQNRSALLTRCCRKPFLVIDLFQTFG